jgi:mono/diheme cytochrome c family protein
MRLGNFFLFALLTSRSLALDRRTPVEQAPAGVVTLQNPYDSREAAKRAGAKLFQRHCASCHGPDGAGRNHAPALASTEVRNAPPGALFWVLRNGSLRHGMPSFSHLPEQRCWQIVTFLKTL